jgi:uncharacterized membrane protein YqjE
VINDREILHGRRETATPEFTGRSLTAIINDLKVEGRAFLNTRLEMLKTELNEKVSAFKSAIPLVVVGAVFAGTAWLVLTAALVCIIAKAFGPGIMSWFYATVIVGVLYLLVGGCAGFFAYSEIKRNSLKPERTLRVLKQDQVWLQNESATVTQDVKNDISIVRRAA